MRETYQVIETYETRKTHILQKQIRPIVKADQTYYKSKSDLLHHTHPPWPSPYSVSKIYIQKQKNYYRSAHLCFCSSYFFLMKKLFFFVKKDLLQKLSPAMGECGGSRSRLPDKRGDSTLMVVRRGIERGETSRIEVPATPAASRR